MIRTRLCVAQNGQTFMHTVTTVLTTLSAVANIAMWWRGRSRPMRTCVRMTSQGNPHARFRRALLTKNPAIIDAAARELPQIDLDDALRIVVVMAEKGDPRYERAAAKWAARLTAERGLAMTETRDVLALLGALRSHPEAAATALRGLL